MYHFLKRNYFRFRFKIYIGYLSLYKEYSGWTKLIANIPLHLASSARWGGFYRNLNSGQNTRQNVAKNVSMTNVVDKPDFSTNVHVSSN